MKTPNNSNSNTTVTTVDKTVQENSLSPTRSYEELSSSEQIVVQELLNKLDDYSDVSLIEFSSDIAANSASEAEDFLKHTKLNDLEEFNACMSDLTKDLRSIDTQELSKVDPNPLSKIPIIGKVLSQSRIGRKVEDVIEKQETVKKSIDLTVHTLEGIKLTLREDLIRCAKTREKTIEFAKNLEYEYIALYKKREELEKTYEEFISSSEYDPVNLDHSEYIEGLQNGIQHIERKMDNTLRYRVNAIQDIPSYSFIRSSENALINAMDDCIKNVVPEWNKSFLKAILAYRVANSSEVLASSKKATNEIITKSAELTSDAIIAAAQAIEAPQITSETLEKKTEIFINTCNELVRIATDASKRRTEDAVRLKEIEEQSIIATEKRRTIPFRMNNDGGISNE